MKPVEQVNDEDLQSWVDNRMAPDQRAAFEARLESDAALRDRAQAYAAQTDLLREAFRARFGDHKSGATQAILAAARRRRSVLPQSGSIAAALLIGVAIGTVGTQKLTSQRQASQNPQASLASYDPLESEAIAAHLTYVVEVRHPVEVGASDETHLGKWLSKRLGKTLVAPDLEKVGFRLMGGRLLPASQGPAAQLMYEDSTGKRLTVYLRADPQSRETAFVFAKTEGVNGFRWTDQGFGYVVFGDVDREHLLQAAKAIYQQIFHSSAPQPNTKFSVFL